jgi:hypothetical protein
MPDAIMRGVRILFTVLRYTLSIRVLGEPDEHAVEAAGNVAQAKFEAESSRLDDEVQMLKEGGSIGKRHHVIEEEVPIVASGRGASNSSSQVQTQGVASPVKAGAWCGPGAAIKGSKSAKEQASALEDQAAKRVAKRPAQQRNSDVAAAKRAGEGAPQDGKRRKAGLAKPKAPRPEGDDKSEKGGADDDNPL